MTPGEWFIERLWHIAYGVPAQMKTPEGAIKAKVSALLAKHGCYKFMPVQMGMGSRTLDYLVCHYGRFLAVETKAPGKDLTALQKECRRKIEAAGGSVFKVSNEVELAELRAALQEIDIIHERALAQQCGHPPGKPL